MKAILILLLLAATVLATETEHYGISVLPAGKITIDGQTGDWDLSGGVFTTSDVENQRDTYATWLHAAYDRDNLYVLARWLDPDPMNNPGQVGASAGFAGDCLQLRFIVGDKFSHWTNWRGRSGKDIMDLVYGKQFNEGGEKDAKTKGAQQAFGVNANGKGYAQEIAIPWSLLTGGAPAPQAGETFRMTVEPNFTVGVSGRMTMKDIFDPKVPVDRVFTFMGSQCWGTATLEKTGAMKPRPVRLSDTREFPVRMERGAPAVNWAGLIQSKELKGFLKVAFSMPEDGYVSLHLRDTTGLVVRQLLSFSFRTKGRHEVLWDGLSTPNWKQPGEPVPAGQYTWKAIWHKGIGLRLRGWAHNAGNAPYDNSPTSNWGGDHGVPVAVVAAGDRVYAGWSGAEAGKALLALDLDGNVVWGASRQGMSGAEYLALDGQFLYAVTWGGPEGSQYIFRLNPANGSYPPWSADGSPDLFLPDLFAGQKMQPKSILGLAADGGKIFISLPDSGGRIAVVDAAGRKLMGLWKVKKPGRLYASAGTLYAIADSGMSVLTFDITTGKSRILVKGLKNAAGVTVDAKGQVYVSLWDPVNQVAVYTPAGKKLSAIGRPGGRAKIGPWQADGMAYASGVAVDGRGQLWVMEMDMYPKRISVWEVASGKFRKEFFGPTPYGAGGGSINPLDPDLMVGSGSEWRIDPQTGRAACLGTITREGMANSRMVVGSNGRLYLATTPGWNAGNTRESSVFERLGDGNYKLRSTFNYQDKDDATQTHFWADQNGDEKQQAGEIDTVPGAIRFSAWYMYLLPDFSIYSGANKYVIKDFTAAGAPRWDFAHPVRMPADGIGSADGELVLQAAADEYAASMTWFHCYSLATGKKLWSYPNNFVGVHGSHKAPPAEVGLIRGAFDPTGSVKVSGVVGNVWAIPTNVGEWHLLTGSGFYLTRLFQPDQMKVVWPEKALPGAIMDNAPPGAGGEDFGGSITQGVDGRVYVQAGKTAFWNLEVTGLDQVKELPGGMVTVAPGDLQKAAAFQSGYLQAATGIRRIEVKKLTPAFTGDLEKDFAGQELAAYQKTANAAVRTALAWDDKYLYAGWEVKDQNPWKNTAQVPEQMYMYGATVDLQLGTDPQADPKRSEPAAGDLRISIGDYRGTPTAVIYRAVSKEKKKKTFSSGVVKEYVLDYVSVLKDVKITVTPKDKAHVVQAAIPFAALGVKPAPPMVWRADFGATHAGPDVGRTRLRTYWNNQETGIVDDAVFELMMQPKNWGEITLK